MVFFGGGGELFFFFNTRTETTIKMIILIVIIKFCDNQRIMTKQFSSIINTQDMPAKAKKN